MRALRGRLRAHARRDGRGDVHREPARAPDRGARPGLSCRPLSIAGRCSGARASTCPSDSFEKMLEEITLELIELPPGEKALLSLTLPAEFVIVFDPVTHTAQFIDVKGEPTRERQSLSIVFNKAHAPTTTVTMQPGPLRLTLENRTDLRLVPGVYVAGQAMHDMLGQAQTVPHRQAPAHQPDLPRHLSHRHARRRSAAQDHQPHLPVHRPQGLDRPLRARRRPGRLRSGQGALPHSARDHRRRIRRSGEDDRRRGDGDLSHARPRGCRRVADARGDAPPERKAPERGPAAQDRHSRRPVPRGDAQRSAGLFRADREHRLARAGTGRLALDPRDRIGGRLIRRPPSCSRPTASSRRRAAFPLRGIAEELAVYEIP